jgi:iron complex transport system permease protein
MYVRPLVPPARRAAALAALAALALAALAVAPFVGMRAIAPSVAFGAAEAEAGERAIFWTIRVARVLTAFLAGAALASSGAAFQALFRNPLAEPFTLGVAGGAAFGASLCLRLGWTFRIAGFAACSVAAFGGAILAILLVYGLTRGREGFAGPRLLLAGVAVSFFFSSVILLLQYLSDQSQTFRVMRWLMGSMDVVGYEPLRNIAPLAAAGAAILLARARELNLLLTGEDLALSRGVRVERVKKDVFLAASLTVGAVVAFCGPIGFIGLMAPHAGRRIVGPDHGALLPASILLGGAFLVACDAVARTAAAPAEIPVGVVTSLLGGPFFLWLLLSRRT